MFWVSVASKLTAYSIQFFEDITFLFSFLSRELLFIAIQYMVSWLVDVIPSICKSSVVSKEGEQI